MRETAFAIVMVVASALAVPAQSLTGAVHQVTVKRGDTLRTLGSRFGVDPRTIASDNDVPPDAPLVADADAQLTIDNRHIVPIRYQGSTIVINVPQRMLFAFSEVGVAGYPVAVGRPGWRTPLGGFAIVRKETNPTWDVPESIRAEARRAGRSLPLRVPPGPNNPLGAHWLGLSGGGVGIHGTNAPRTVYQVTTHGCIRLHPDDVAALFDQVEVGTAGAIVYQPVLVAEKDGDVFVEAHRDVYARGPSDPVEYLKTLTHEMGLFERIDWEAAARVVDLREGIARVVTRAPAS